VPAKHASTKASRSNLSVSPTINQQIVTWNKYAPLHNLRDSDAVSNDLQSHREQRSQATLTSNKTTNLHGKGKKIPTIVNWIQQPGDDQKPEGMKASEWTHISTRQKVKKKVLDRRPKIIVLGDSHTRGIAGELRRQSKHRFNIIGYTMPNAGLADIINSAEGKISELTRADTVIVFGGTNDIEKSKQCSNLTSTVNFLENTRNTTGILMEVPVRYAAGARPSISEQIVSYNKKLHKVTKKYKHVKLVRVTTSSYHFTTHGLHLNYNGREAMTKEILNNLTSNCEHENLPAIEVTWKNEQENVNVQITGKESSKEMLDKKADTEEAREMTVIAGGKYIESETGIEAISILAANETVRHIDKQEISSKPPATGVTSKEIHRNSKSQCKCPEVKNDALLWI
jgi:hypothetical protein